MLLSVKYNAQSKPCFKKYLEGKVLLIKQLASSPEVRTLISIANGEEAPKLSQPIDAKKLCCSMLKFK